MPMSCERCRHAARHVMEVVTRQSSNSRWRRRGAHYNCAFTGDNILGDNTIPLLFGSKSEINRSKYYYRFSLCQIPLRVGQIICKRSEISRCETPLITHIITN
ncbi:hypothetical protein J6590_065042 [Homalodisca vitripennis]|nr:hypothetical protein J6590_065042 [Homalodisca vitripennis]